MTIDVLSSIVDDVKVFVSVRIVMMAMMIVACVRTVQQVQIHVKRKENRSKNEQKHLNQTNIQTK